MKIALIGYGKMGREIEALAVAGGHEIVLKIQSSNATELSKASLSKADVAIEFTRPEAAVHHLLICLEAGIPVVTGTTGWYRELETIKTKCISTNGALLYASNFSIGVQVFFSISRKLGEMMNKLPDYEVKIEETHHLQKLDKPSGTALTLAENLLEVIGRKKSWVDGTQQTAETELPVHSFRKDKVVGLHRVIYHSDIDNLTITHEAMNRKGFASGAIQAASWLKDKKGFFSMDDFMKDFFS